MGIRVFNQIFLFSSCLIMMFSLSFASVVLEGINVTLSFEDIESNFGPTVEEENGICGTMYIAEPLDACSSLTNKIERSEKQTCASPFALIIRGGCSFEDKIRRAQSAGFEAAVVYDSVDYGPLIAMAGNSAGIKIPAVFVSKASGEKLKTYVGLDMELWILPSYENSAWSIMVISFISLLAMSAVLATCFLVRRYRMRRGRSHSQVREFHGMSSRLVKAMPSLIFTAVTEDNCTSSTCAICLEDYSVGDKLRILPCHHKFHAFCVDAWLTSWRTFCPVCKRDARTTTGEPPASESTPLLSANPSSAVPTPQSSFRSFRSSSMHSSAIHIASPNLHSHVAARDQSVSSSPQIPQLLCSSHHLRSPSMRVSRSSLDLRNMSQISDTSQFVSPCSLGYLSPSRLNTRYMSPYNASPSSASSSYTREPNPLHYSESTRRLSPHTSMKSLPRS